MKQKKGVHKHIFFAGRVFLWFFLGAILGLFFFISFIVIYYKQTYQNRVYPGIFVNNIDFGGKSEQDVETYFNNKNSSFQNTIFTLTYQTKQTTVSAKTLKLGYDAKLLADQAYSVGRSDNTFSDIYMLTRAYMRGIYLPPSYSFDEDSFLALLKPFQDQINVDPVNAAFTYEMDE